MKQKPKHLPIREPLKPITSSSPFDLISVDFVHLEQSSGGYEYILVIVDHFTKFAQAYPTKNKSGTTVAMKIFSELIPRFGFPGRIIHDQAHRTQWSTKPSNHTLSSSRKWNCGTHEQDTVRYVEDITRES